MTIGGRRRRQAREAWRTGRAPVFALFALFALSCPLQAALPDAAPPLRPLEAPDPRGRWMAEGGPGYGRGQGGREHMDRRDAQHEERMRRRREAWERRERMTPEERRSLRRDLHEANRDLYRP